MLIQGSPNSCAVKCQQLILREFGIDVKEEDLIRIAEEHGWYHPESGTYMRDNGKLLAGFGIRYVHSQHNSLGALRNWVSGGHSVMANVNSNKLMDFPVGNDHDEAAHCVLVREVGEEYVWITDTATGQERRKIPVKAFLQAWDDSCRYLLATVDVPDSAQIRQSY